jgi:multiple antibiotic resistance protein
MPLMVGPGAIATTLGMTSLVKHSEIELLSFFAITAAILAAMLVTYLCLAYARNLLGQIGPMGIDAVTRIVGFFVSAMGVGLVFHGVIEGLQDAGMLHAG